MALTAEQLAEIAARPLPAVPGLTGPGAGVPAGPFDGQYVEGDQAFFRAPDGSVFGAPAQNAGLALQENPAWTPATEEDVRRYDEKKELGALMAAGKDLTGAAVRGMGWVANLGLGAAQLLGAPKKYRPQTTEEYRAAGSALWAGMTGDDMSDAWDESIRASDLEREKFPTLMSVSRTAGDLLGMAASGGLSLGSGAGRLAAGAGVGRFGTAAAAVAGEAAEGAIQGGLSAFDTLDTQPTRERILAAMGMGALLAGSLGVGVRGAAAGAGAAANAVARNLPDLPLLRRAFGQPEVSVSGFKQLLDEGLDPHEALARTLGKDVSEITPEEIAHAGKVIEETARAQRMPRITANNFDDIRPEDVTDLGAAANREVIEEGAAKSMRRDADAVFAKSFKATEELRNLALKEDLVHANFVRDNVDQLAAYEKMGNRLAEIRQNLGQTIAQMPAKLEKKAKKAVEDQLFLVEQAEAKFRGAQTGAEAYVALDQLRRGMLAQRPGFESMARAQANPRLMAQGRALFQTLDQEYHGLADFLMDAGTFGRQGEAQAAVNRAMVQAIPEKKLALRNFASEVGEDYGRPVFGADPDKIRSYLRTLGKESLRDENFRRFLDTQEGLMRAADAGYALSPESRKLLLETQQAVTQLRSTLDKAEDLMRRGEEGARALGEGAVAQGQMASIGGHLLGGPLGGAVASGVAGAMVGGRRGAAVGALTGLVPGLGYANTIRMAQRARAFANTTDSAVVNSLADWLERATGLQKELPRLAGGKLKSDLRLDARGPGGTVGIFGPSEDTTKSRNEAFRSRAEWLANHSPERSVTAGEQALGPIMQAAPALGAAMLDSFNTKVANLQEAWPKTLSNSLVPSRRDNTPSSNELQRAEALWSATFQPLTVFDDFKKGRLDFDKAMFCWKQWPDLQLAAQSAVVDLLQSLPSNALFPDEKISSLDLFLGMNGALDDTLRPEFLQTMALVAPLAAAEDQRSQSPPPRAATDFAKNQQTFTERLMQT